MNESVLLVLGLVAAAFSTGSFLPQVIRSWKTKRTHDLSLITLLMLFVGSILWFTYGIILKDIPIIVANGIINILLLS
ncbi:MAG: SemiSWEET transporter, partial [Planctomycetes bacterium]|nr:SemiSWEET transporter [Planctomycetota bacterium]